MKYFILLLILVGTCSLAGDLSSTISVTNAYVARGTEQNLYHKPAALGFVTYDSGSWYASAFAANMNYAEGTTFELDGFGGYRFKGDVYTLDVGFASINYPTSPNKLNFIEYDVKLDRPVGKGSMGVWVGYTDAYFYSYGPGRWYEIHGSYPLSDRVSVSGAVATQQLRRGFSYSTYNIGFTVAITKTWSVDARFSDTDRHDLDPVFNSYDDRASVTLTKAF